MLSIEGARTVWARCVRARGRVVLVALAGVVGLAVAAPVSAGQVSQVDPPRVSVDTAVSLTGTGFDPTPGNNRVTFSPPTGAPQSTLASLVSTADAARGIRRLSVRVPAGLPDGRTGIRVTNLVTGEETEAGFLEVVSFAVSPAAGRAGTGPNRGRVARVQQRALRQRGDAGRGGGRRDGQRGAGRLGHAGDGDPQPRGDGRPGPPHGGDAGVGPDRLAGERLHGPSRRGRWPDEPAAERDLDATHDGDGGATGTCTRRRRPTRTATRCSSS